MLLKRLRNQSMFQRNNITRNPKYGNIVADYDFFRVDQMTTNAVRTIWHLEQWGRKKDSKESKPSSIFYQDLAKASSTQRNISGAPVVSPNTSFTACGEIRLEKGFNYHRHITIIDWKRVCIFLLPSLLQFLRNLMWLWENKQSIKWVQQIRVDVFIVQYVHV